MTNDNESNVVGQGGTSVSETESGGRSSLACPGIPPSPTSGYDYTNQAWVENGWYVACGHPSGMVCKCFGKLHAGEPVRTDAVIR